MRTVEELQELAQKTNDPIYRLAALIRATLDKDLPVLIAVTGRMGRGKSTLAAELAYALLGDELSLDKHFVFTREQFHKRLRELEKYSVMVFDEGVGAHKRKSMEKQQVELVEMMNKIRVYRTVVIFNVPSFWSLDRGIRENIVFWIYIPRRGEALVIPRPENPLVDDPWDMFKNMTWKIIVDEIESTIKGGDIPDYNDIAERVVSSFAAMRLKYGPYPDPEFWAEYQKRSEKAKKEIDEIPKDYVPISLAASLTGLPRRAIVDMIAATRNAELKLAPEPKYRLPYLVVNNQVRVHLPTLQEIAAKLRAQDS